MAPGAPSDTLRLRLRLADTDPPVWRRLLVPAGLGLARLHRAIQAVFAWEDAHGHVFRIGEGEYGRCGGEEGFALRREGASLDSLGVAPGDRFTYEYGLEDPWVLVVTLEARTPSRVPLRVPRCTAGALAAPPEEPRCQGETPSRAPFDRALAEDALRRAFQGSRRRISTS
jgi:hypothetical protein